MIEFVLVAITLTAANLIAIQVEKFSRLIQALVFSLLSVASSFALPDMHGVEIVAYCCVLTGFVRYGMALERSKQ